MTTTPQEPGENTEPLAHSDGEPDEVREQHGGDDVGGPAEGTESNTEDALTAPSGVGDDETDSQSRNPL